MIFNPAYDYNYYSMQSSRIRTCMDYFARKLYIFWYGQMAFVQPFPCTLKLRCQVTRATNFLFKISDYAN